jgi:lactate dehydrogenase-like 2-hydroxyacid dehydrogenase
MVNATLVWKAYFSLNVGPEHVDLPAIARRGVQLGFTPDVLTDAGWEFYKHSDFLW